VAALPFRVPVAHIHGGEETEGAIDDALRHSMTKLSHLHFVALEAYARRVMQLGEEPWRITVCGALSLDNLSSMQLFSPAELESQYGICLDPPPLLVTFHPVTLEHERTEWQITELLAALEETGLPVVFTLPNADTGNHTIRERIAAFTRASSNAWSLDNLGSRGYFSLMRAAAAMVGNSSSGIIEAPSLGLPVVNIGTRQTGRVRAANVIDTGYSRAEIEESIRRALAPDFRAGLSGLQNPYGDGKAAEGVLERLKSTPLGPSLLVKRFYDSPGQRQSADE
jgi:UDP-N-acetylglucosamine 2-epimerase (non-hydrolysing)/GDP/UDP-N,N'-diacetylbacillosamine 2-epimerase (hydrolysing)